MRFLNAAQWGTLGTLIVILIIFSSYNSNSYTTKDILEYLNSLDTGFFDKQVEVEVDEELRLQELKHKFQQDVEDLLQTKYTKELEYERGLISRDRNLCKEKIGLINEKMKELNLKIEQAKGKVYSSHDEYDFIDYRVDEFKFESTSSQSKSVDPNSNENIIFSIISSSFGKDGNYESFIKLILSIDGIVPSKTTISFLVTDENSFRLLKAYCVAYFEKVESIEDMEKQKDFFSKFILVQAQFLKSESNDDIRSTNMENFLISSTLRNEKYSLIIDPKITELPKNFYNILIESDKDIAVLNVSGGEEEIDQTKQTEKGDAVDPELENTGKEGTELQGNGLLDVDSKDTEETIENKIEGSQEKEKEQQEGAQEKEDTLFKREQANRVSTNSKSWKGTKLKPSKEELEKIKNDRNYKFKSKLSEGSFDLEYISKNLENFNLGNEVGVSVELNSVDSKILFIKSEILKQGINFPSYNIIGTSWDEYGYDGFGSEGLCYQANTIGYKCWGFPNLIANYS